MREYKFIPGYENLKGTEVERRCALRDKLKNGEINPEKMITHSYDFDGLINGFEIMREKKEEYVKVMMVR